MLSPQYNQFREVQDLSGLWDFCFDREDIGESAGWQKGLPETQPFAVPGTWNEQAPLERDYTGTGWYQTRFSVPELWKDKVLKLRFDSVIFNAKVWLNGEHVGEHSGGWIAFEFDVGSFVQFDRPNLLVVRVDRKLSLETIPQHGEGTGHWTAAPGKDDKFPPCGGDYLMYCGLTRPVKLYTLPKAHISDVTVKTDIDGDKGLAEVVVEVTGQAKVAKVAVGNVCSELAVTDGRAEGTLTIPSATFWSPENPHLYDLKVTLKNGADVLDTYELAIGIRTIKVEGDKLLLNGKPLNLRGVSRHEYLPGLGHAIPPSVDVKDLALLKWLNCNSFRTSHYPQSEELLDAADRLGILVIDECPANTLFSFRKDQWTAEQVVSPALLENHKRAMQELIARDKNHPCVLAWSMMNEPDIEHPASAEYFGQIYNYIKSLDDTRPVIYTNCLPSSPAHDKYSDFLCKNLYFWIYNSWCKGDWEKVREAVSNRLDEAHAGSGGKPILASEFGAPGIPGFHSLVPENWTEEYQAKHLETYLDVIESKPYTIGAHIWVFSDFKTPQHAERVINNNKGLFTADRQPKLAAHMIRKRWAPENRKK